MNEKPESETVLRQITVLPEDTAEDLAERHDIGLSTAKKIVDVAKEYGINPVPLETTKTPWRFDEDQHRWISGSDES